MSNKPTNCNKCRKEFMRRSTLQAESLATALREGDAAAEMDVNEALAEYHEGGHQGDSE